MIYNLVWNSKLGAALPNKVVPEVDTGGDLVLPDHVIKEVVNSRASVVVQDDDDVAQAVLNAFEFNLDHQHYAGFLDLPEVVDSTANEITGS